MAGELLGMLAQSYPALLEARYGIQIASGDSIGDIFEAIARRRGFLRAGGEIDEERTAAVLLDEFPQQQYRPASRSTDAKREMRLCR